MAKTSKKPSGLSVSRNGPKFVLSWKKGQKYKTQTVYTCIATSFKRNGKPAWPMTKKKKRKYTKHAVKANASAYKFTRNKGLAAISFYVVGKADGKKSAASKKKEYIIVAPNKPNLSMSIINDLTSKFEWDTSVNNTTTKHFVTNQFSNALVLNCNTANGEDISGWSNLENKVAKSSWTKEEVGWDIQSGSRTRWVRIRSSGWAGRHSAWAYAKRVYALPNPASNLQVSRSAWDGSGYSVFATWTSPESHARPIDTATVEYATTIPDVDVVYPSEKEGTVTMTMSCPTSGVSWTSAGETGGVYSENREYSFAHYDSIPLDNCFYLTIANKHDNFPPTRCTPVLASGEGVGSMKEPSKPEATPSIDDPHIYDIKVANKNSSVPNVATEIFFRTSSKQNKLISVGVIPPGATTTRCRIPEFPDGDSISFGARNFIGNYTPKEYSSYALTEDTEIDPNKTYYTRSGTAPDYVYTPVENPVVEDLGIYYEALSLENNTIVKVVPLMTSNTVWGAGVPLPPSITVREINQETVQVTWNQSWADATEAELSWADHDDAWISTSGPSTYTVSAVNAGKWNISGLGVGTWYIRVRLIKTEGESKSYSAYSNIKDGVIELSKSPKIPSLLLSSGVIPKTGSVTCYWAYVSNDGTSQRQAKIYEAFLEYEPVSSPTGSPYDNGYYEAVILDTYTPVNEPTGNPSEQGWYELIDDEYVLTQDTTVDDSKTYYTRDVRYTRSLDTTVVTGKTYYQPNGNITYSAKEIVNVATAQSVTIRAVDREWDSGETHHLAVQVTSASGKTSEGFSAPVPVTIADEPTVDILSTSLRYVKVPSDYDEQGDPIDYRYALSMIEFPLDIQISELAPGNTVTCIIDRAADFHVDRPDESEFEGFKGETILMKEYNTSSISITQDDLIGSFDDDGKYGITIILNDVYGQSAEATKIPGTYLEVEEPTGNPSEQDWYEAVINETVYVEFILTQDTEVDETKTYYTLDKGEMFEIHWEHQAVLPSATIEADRVNNVTYITPIMPETGYSEGDVVDIYRLSADPPELIYPGAVFGTTYVDPYPTLGEFGGHRIVYRTVNGDYITQDNELAIEDYEADENPEYKHDLFGLVIDFDDDQLILPYNVTVSHSWTKDFTLTKYLGGAVQGDWNPAVERSVSANAVIPVEVEPANVELLRRLAVYSGICHVRTPDGSSFAANINVKDDREEKWTTRLSKVSLDISRCDPEGYEAMTYRDWEESQS